MRESGTARVGGDSRIVRHRSAGSSDGRHVPGALIALMHRDLVIFFSRRITAGCWLLYQSVCGRYPLRVGVGAASEETRWARAVARGAAGELGRPRCRQDSRRPDVAFGRRTS